MLIKSGIPALSDAEHILWDVYPAERGQDCLHSLSFFPSASLKQFTKAVYESFPIGSLLPAPMRTRFIQLSVSGFQTVGGWNQSAASLCSLLSSLLSPRPRRGFCCCISAFLHCVQEVSQNALIETNMRLEHVC